MPRHTQVDRLVDAPINRRTRYIVAWSAIAEASSRAVSKADAVSATLAERGASRKGPARRNANAEGWRDQRYALGTARAQSIG